jgi:hypothetical protein
MSKYYTPNIEEFHVGFRYQSHADPRTDNGWDDEVVDRNSIIYPLKVDSDVDYRVKYLDDDDIQELGWERFGKKSFKLEKSFKLDTDYLHKIEFILSWEDFEKSIIEILDSNGNTLFYGKINNYNELEKIMEQLEIVNDNI